MFCEKDCVFDDSHPDRIDWRQVQVLSMRENLLAICSSRSDQIAASLERRLLDLDNTDLVAVEERYHFQCRKDFKPKLPEETTPGRPIDKDRQFYFEEVCSWLESEAEIHTLSEIYNQMAEIACSEDTIYSRKWLKTKIEEKYGDHVMFTKEILLGLGGLALGIYTSVATLHWTGTKQCFKHKPKILERNEQICGHFLYTRSNSGSLVLVGKRSPQGKHDIVAAKYKL